MKTTVFSLLGLTAIIILIGCDGNNLSDTTGSNPLEGTWSEPFEWYDPIPIYVDPGWGPYGISRTSTITFSENEFTIMVLPHRRGFISTPDSTYIGAIDDTLYVGTYWFIHDTIWFHRDGVDRPTRFEYRFDPDGLYLIEDPIAYFDPETGAPVFPIFGPRSFLWAHSSRKGSGLFTRVE